MTAPALVPLVDRDPGDCDCGRHCPHCLSMNGSAAVHCGFCGRHLADHAPRRVLVMRRHSDRVWRGEPGSAAIFCDRGQVTARTAAELLGLAIKCWSAGITLILDHSREGRPCSS